MRNFWETITSPKMGGNSAKLLWANILPYWEQLEYLIVPKQTVFLI